MSITEFLNQGGGLYDIRIVPFIDNPACAWLSGEYVYAIQLEFTRTIGGETVVLQGGTRASWRSRSPDCRRGLRAGGTARVVGRARRLWK